MHHSLPGPLSMRFYRKEYWLGCHVLLQGIFPTQGSNPHLLHLLHWQVGSLPLGKPTKSLNTNKSASTDSPSRARAKETQSASVRAWKETGNLLARFACSLRHLKIIIGDLSLDHPTWIQSWRVNSYLSITKGTELVLKLLPETLESPCWPRPGWSSCLPGPWLGAIGRRTSPVCGQSLGAGNPILLVFVHWQYKKIKRKARRFELPVSMNSRLSTLSWQIKRCFITNNGATWSDDTRPPVHYNSKSSQWNKSCIACVTQNPQSLSHTRPVFLESQRVYFKVIWKQNTIMLKQVSSHLTTALNLQSSRQHSIKSNYQPGLECFPWNTITKTGGTENSWRYFMDQKKETKMEVEQRFPISTLFLCCPEFMRSPSWFPGTWSYTLCLTQNHRVLKCQCYSCLTKKQGRSPGVWSWVGNLHLWESRTSNNTD